LHCTVNKHNFLYWSAANRREIHQTTPSPFYDPKVTVWWAVWSRGVIGPYFFDDDDDGKAITVTSQRSSSIGPVADATDVLQPSRLIVLTLSPPHPVWTFSRSPPGTPTSTTTREILVAKGGTKWARINR